MSVLAKLLASALSRRSPGRQLVVLTFHRVLAARDPFRPGEPDAAEFASQAKMLASAFNVLRLDRAVAAWREAKLPPRAVAITFDDGYRDNHDIALPILRQAGIPATFFIATGYMGSHSMFNDVVIEAIRATTAKQLVSTRVGPVPLPLDSFEAKQAAVSATLGAIKRLPPSDRHAAAWEIARQLGLEQDPQLMMRAEHVRALDAAGMEIGAHTINHPILATLDASAAAHEIETSRVTLRELLGRDVVGFAYPNGRPAQDYAAKDVECVRRAGFDYAVSTRYASWTPEVPSYELPRMAPFGRNNFELGLRVARGFAVH
jgi:peptidoglycan/xylan/chitin deacetylase (PgdA/CDA1 family)